jgi:hypothetical protein
VKQVGNDNKEGTAAWAASTEIGAAQKLPVLAIPEVLLHFFSGSQQFHHVITVFESVVTVLQIERIHARESLTPKRIIIRFIKAKKKLISVANTNKRHRTLECELSSPRQKKRASAVPAERGYQEPQFFSC